MRIATFLVVLLIHAGLLMLFAPLHIRLPRAGEAEAPSTAFFVPLDDKEATDPADAPQPSAAALATHPRGSRRAAARPPNSRSPSDTALPEAPSNAITVPTTPDWRGELQIAANNEIAAEQRRREHPSPLAPHDFSGVKPGSTDDSKPKFGWSYAATHRVQEIPGGGLLIHINDHCAIAWVVFPLAICKIGKIRANGKLLEHMRDTPALGE